MKRADYVKYSAQKKENMRNKKLTLKAYLTIKRQDLYAIRSNSQSVREAWKCLRSYLV